MRRPLPLGFFLACAAGLASPVSEAPAQSAEPPYVILLRSRSGAVTPEKSKQAQTGGGFIQVTQLKPNLIMVLMRGAVAAGAGPKAENAAMQFELNQDFEIVPTRGGLRPPHLSLTGWAIGALDSTDREGGTAEHSPACAAVQSNGNNLVNLCVNPHGVSGGQDLLVNDRVGPLETTIAAGCFTLHQTFAMNASQPRCPCHSGSAVADFDPEPKLDSRWNYALKPFRAVPHKDFGFRVLLRVVEEPPPPAADLPPPKPAVKEAALEVEDRPANP